MRKLFLVALFALAASFAPVASAQTPQNGNGDNIPNMGRAPRTLDGIGRVDLRVVDEDGNPVKGVKAELESRRLNGMFCEAWNYTDARGVAVIPPLHMGRLTLKLKADGFQKQEITIDPNKLDEPVRVTLVRKRG